MKKHYTGLFITVMLLVVVCCIYGSGANRGKHAASDTQTQSISVVADDSLTVIEDEPVPVSNKVHEDTASVHNGGASIILWITSLLLVILVTVIVIVIAVAGTVTLAKKI